MSTFRHRSIARHLLKLRLVVLACLLSGVSLALMSAPARAQSVDSSIQPAESISLPSGDSQYFYVGSTAGGYPMGSITWAEDLAVTAAYSGNEAISIGRSTSDSGSYSCASGNHAIAGAGTSGYAVTRVSSAHASAVGPGYSGGPETPAVGVSLDLPFTTQSGDLVLILVGGQGTGNLQLSGISASTLQNNTYSEAGSDVIASAAVYTATLPAGSYSAHWDSTTYLTNSGTSLGAVAYVLQPGSSSPPANTSPPVVSGKPAVGKTLSCTKGLWTNNPTSYTYRWLRDGSKITNATRKTYTVRAADQGHGLVCRVTATNSAGQASATSNSLMVGLRIVFVDVGHGDAIILRYGSWTGLIDGGPGGSGLTIAKELTLTGADHVDTLLITHAHNDHIGGLLDNVTFGGQSGQLIDLIDPSQVYYGLAPSSSLTGSGGSCSDWPDLWNTHLESFPTKLHQVHAGDSLSWGGPSAVVLNPPKGAPAPTTDANANADSVVVRLTFGGKGFLFAGDLTSGDNENTVATQLQGGPPIYLLKVAHHGFGDATSSGFVNAAFIRKTPFPHVAVISCGSDSGSKPPATTNLWAANTPVYSTLNSGTISLTVTSSGKATWNFPDYHVVANKQDTPLTDSLRVTVQPQSQTVKAGQTASFTAAAPGKPSVEWQVSTDGSGSWTELPGSFSPAATSTTYTFTARTVQNGNHYRAVFTNSLGSATSNAAMLTVK